MVGSEGTHLHAVHIFQKTQCPMAIKEFHGFPQITYVHLSNLKSVVNTSRMQQMT